jgi:cell division septation protein DedD
MARSSNIHRARELNHTKARFWLILGLVVAILGGGLLFYNQQKPSLPAKGGQLIVRPAPVFPETKVRPKEQELSFYKTLTEKADKAPSVVHPRPPQKTEGSSRMNSSRAAKATSVQAYDPLTKRFTLQVGSFMEQSSAQKFVSRLVGKGYPAYLSKTQLPTQDVRYRVRVGAFEDKDKAKILAERLEKEEGLKSFIAFAEPLTQ